MSIHGKPHYQDSITSNFRTNVGQFEKELLRIVNLKEAKMIPINKIIPLIAIMLIAGLSIEAQKNPSMLYKIAEPAITNPGELSSFKGFAIKHNDYLDLFVNANASPNFNVYCFPPYQQCLGIYNQSGLRQFDYQYFYMIVDIVFDKNTKTATFDGTVDIQSDAGQNSQVYIQDIIWEYENNPGSWVTISQSGLSFSNIKFDVKTRGTGQNRQYYIRLRFAPKNVYIGNFNSIGGIPSGKYGFELKPRFTLLTLS